MTSAVLTNAGVTHRRSSPWRALGPAFVAAVAYVDPGNIATNTSAGGLYGFALLWVVVLATLMAGPVQYLAAKLGTASGSSLAELVAARTTPMGRRAFWAQGQLVAIATDVAEIIGAALAMHLLWQVPLLVGGGLAAVSSTAVLLLQDRFGGRVLQLVSLFSLVAIGAGFGYGLRHDLPGAGDLAGGLVPHLGDNQMVLLACGIVGATVMPHAIYLHSDLATGPSLHPLRTRLRVVRTDVLTAMVIAGAINVSMLLLGASLLSGSGAEDIDAMVAELGSRAGDGAATAFLVALLASGFSSSAVGTQAGAGIARSLLHRRLHPLALRALTIVPAFTILAIGVPPVQALVLSQVLLALGLPFALIPLLRLTADPAVVGESTNRRPLRLAATAIVAIVVLLDLTLVALTLLELT
ncbi:Nramp family divalent metal transporter [Calidifontibacter indicus]|uniref:Nramp family divalent metal transporter n=1 Tax=Calidifontibacter indicus TaxID=419650 RepID=UPI003D706571